MMFRTIGRKGDVDRYLVMTLITLIMLIIIVALFYGGAYSMVQNLFIKEFLK
jgi:hypothetical protein